MPLKVLHGILVDPPIAIVGISNWALDAAKMNRAVCLQRPEPKASDLQATGEAIVHAAAAVASAAGHGDDKKSASLSLLMGDLSTTLHPLAAAYHTVYTQQQQLSGGRDFIGMRDYYSMLKSLRGGLISMLGSKRQSGLMDLLNAKTLDLALRRNFGGKPKLLAATLQVFREHCYDLSARGGKDEDGGLSGLSSVPTLDLVKANLEDASARHLMLLTRHSAALPLLFGAGILVHASSSQDRAKSKQGVLEGAYRGRSCTVLIGSDFEEDKSELRLVQQINEVKRAMGSGKVVVLVNHDQIYEGKGFAVIDNIVLQPGTILSICHRVVLERANIDFFFIFVLFFLFRIAALYDVLNQRYISRTSQTTGKTKRMLRLAIGAKSQLCPVADGFRVVVIAEQAHAYANLDLP